MGRPPTLMDQVNKETKKKESEPHRRNWGDIPMEKECSVDSSSLGGDKYPRCVVERLVRVPGNAETSKILADGAEHAMHGLEG